MVCKPIAKTVKSFQSFRLSIGYGLVLTTIQDGRFNRPNRPSAVLPIEIGTRGDTA